MTIEMKDGQMADAAGTLFSGLSLRAEGGQIETVEGLPPKAREALAHALLGLLPLQQGSVAIDGEPMTRRSAAWLRRHLAYVPAQVRWPDDDRRSHLSTEEVHRLMMENAATAASPIVIIDTIGGADEEQLCQRMAQAGRAVVVIR